MDVTTGAGVLVLAIAVALQAAARARTRAKALRRIKPAAQPRIPHPRRGPGRSRADDELALAARAMARAVRAGSSPAQAIAVAAREAPGLPHLRACAKQASHAGLAAACRGWRQSDGRPGVRLITAALELSGASGGSLARALDGVGDTVEARAAVRREVRAQAATARTSAAVLVAAPTVFAGFSLVTDSSALAFLTRTQAGLTCLLLAIGLDAAGAAWMARITGGVA